MEFPDYRHSKLLSRWTLQCSVENELYFWSIKNTWKVTPLRNEKLLKSDHSFFIIKLTFEWLHLYITMRNISWEGIISCLFTISYLLYLSSFSPFVPLSLSLSLSLCFYLSLSLSQTHTLLHSYFIRFFFSFSQDYYSIWWDWGILPWSRKSRLGDGEQNAYNCNAYTSKEKNIIDYFLWL